MGDLSKVPVQYRDSVRRLIIRKVDQRVSEEMINLRNEALAEIEYQNQQHESKIQQALKIEYGIEAQFEKPQQGYYPEANSMMFYANGPVGGYEG